MFMPIYDQNDFGRYMLTYEEYIPVPLYDSALSLFVKTGAIDNNKVDDFFYFYLGSRDGLRGYSYYSLGGRKIAMARLTYRFPIIRNINKQLLFTYLGSLYGGVFFEAGSAWKTKGVDLDDYKRDVGFELRFKGFNFYSYPLAASFEAAYGLDDVIYVDPFTRLDTNYEGKQWKLYGTLSYDF
jgi:outer membrane protein assembly factor BamA